MIRTSSRFASCILAVSLLGGCHVTIQSGPQAQPQRVPPTTPPARTAARQPAQPARQPVPTPPKRRFPTSNAPRVNTQTVFGTGSGGAFQGLAYVIPENTQQLPQLSGLVPFATLYTDRFDVKPQEFTSGFPGALIQNEWFALRYEGEFTVPTDGIWQFRVTSDDGAILYIDDRRVVVNDGVHTARSADGETQLKAGSHWLRLEYFQASRGQVALMVLVGQKGKLTPLAGGR
jgi:PA14 domain